MIATLVLLLGVFRSALQGRADLLLENLALRQQLAVFSRSGRRPRISVPDKLFWTALRRFWSRWTDVLVFVNPETVIRWHRAGLRHYWIWLSRRRRPGRPTIDPFVREQIRRLAMENPTWGAPRVHGELHLLGLDVSERDGEVIRY
jgi:hypothetical protein